jgi:signal peptidase II
MCVGCDQTTKHLAQTNLPIYQMFSYLGDTIRLQYVLNTGAAFSLGATLPENMRWWIFVVGQGVFLLFLSLYLIKNHDLRSSQFYGFALILGGGLGNFYDRIFRDGAVVDFLNIGFGNFLRTAIFNVADIAITFGLVLLVIGIYRNEEKKKAKELNELNAQRIDNESLQPPDSNNNDAGKPDA